MNYLRVHAAARKRVKARKDILGLLRNEPKRQQKKKAKPLFTQRPFGIFGRAISFKVVLGSALQSNSRRAPSAIQVLPIGRVVAEKKSTRKSKPVSKLKLDKSNAPNDNKKQKPKQAGTRNPLADLLHVNGNWQRDLEPSETHMNFNASMKKSDKRIAQIDHWAEDDTAEYIQRDETTVDRLALSDDYKQANGHQTPADFTSNASTRTSGMPLEILSFDSLVESDLDCAANSLTNSINFQQNGNPNDASQPESQYTIQNGSFDLPIEQNGLRTPSTNRDSTPAIIEPSRSSGWSLNTPNVAGQLDGSSSDSLQSFNSEITKKMAGREPTKTGSIEELTNWTENSSLLLTQPQTQLADDEHKFTMEMVMERKALGARRAMQKLFPKFAGFPFLVPKRLT